MAFIVATPVFHNNAFPQLKQLYNLITVVCIHYSPSVTNMHFFPDARIIRRGLLWLWGCRSLEDRPLLLQTRPRGSHCHGNGELYNEVERGTWEGHPCPFLCQWTQECLFSHLNPRCCCLGCGFGSGNENEKHFVDLHQLGKCTTRLRASEGDWMCKSWWKTVVVKLVENLLNCAGMYWVYSFTHQTASVTHFDDWLLLFPHLFARPFFADHSVLW